ncbi:unnamed protein product [Mesocestoides corti]|uniref:histone acetyltransferase n=1 Tax=Mesocestoides corti TaxID=53468 RepID=A0A0R3UNK4_MESCO|nr:unnamed protein product [Mesocestoides corti]
MSDVAGAIELRFARRNDIRSIQRLCSECFPVHYPDSWYADLVSTAKYLTILATLPMRTSTGERESSVVGMIVAEYRTLSSCKVIDRTIIHPRLATKSFVMYILSLGVTSQFRNCGIVKMFFTPGSTGVVVDLVSLFKPPLAWLCFYLLL